MDAAQEPASACRTRWLLGLILLLAFLSRADELDDPWSDRGFKSAFGAFATGAHARGLFEHGFLESGGLPYYWRVELEDGTVLRDWYAHHPPFYAWVSAASMRLLGPSELALRLPWTLASVLAIVPLFRLAALVWGARAGLLAALLFAVVPYASWWGTLAWCDFVVMALYCVALRRYVLWLRAGGARHVIAIAACFLAGGLVDWTMHFLLPALGLHAVWIAWRRGGARAIAPLLLWPAAVLLSLAVHRLHMRLVLPPELARSDARATLAWVTTLPEPLSAFLARQARYVVRYATWPIAVLAGVSALVALVRALAGRLPAERWVLLLMLPPGAIYALGFPARSVNHDFFAYLSAPGLALAAALCLDALWAAPFRLGRARHVLMLAVLLSTVSWSLHRRHSLYGAERSDRVAALVAEPAVADLIGDPGAVVLTCVGLGQCLPFYSRAPIVHEVNDVARFEELRATMLSHLGTDRRVAFLFDVGSNAGNPEAVAVLLPLLRHLEGSAGAVQEVRSEGAGLDLRLFELGSPARE